MQKSDIHIQTIKTEKYRENKKKTYHCVKNRFNKRTTVTYKGEEIKELELDWRIYDTRLCKWRRVNKLPMSLATAEEKTRDQDICIV